MFIRKLRQTLMALCGAICVVYLVYRGLYTLNLSSVYAGIASWMLYLAELWGCASLGLFFLQVWDDQEPHDQPVLEDAQVDVFVPSYDEDTAILRGTLQACLAMDYPHRTFLLDDGNREEVRMLCEELGVHYITRDSNMHAKAGNLNNALDQTSGEFIAILDADHIPEPHFISKMIGHFRNPEVGMVQSPHAFSNFDTFQGRVNYEKGRFWDEGLLFYKVIQPGRNATNSVIFAGSAAIFRRKALKEVGYIATETITEDMHTGIRLSAAGWDTIYVGERLIAGQGATDVTTFHSQRLRWAEGNLTILRHDNPLTMRGLDLKQRLTYFASIIHWGGGIPRLILYLTPLMMLLSGVSPVKEFTPTLAGVFISYIGVMMLALRSVYRGYTNYDLVEFFNMANFWTQMQATWRAMFTKRKAKFVVTNKRGGRQGSVLPHIMPQIILLASMWVGLAYGWVRHLMFDPKLDLIGLGIATFLILHHSRYAVAYLRCAMAPASKRETYRHRLNLPVSYSFKDEEGNQFKGIGVTTDLCDSGLGLIAYTELPHNVPGEVSIKVGRDRLATKAVVRHVAHHEGEAGRGLETATMYRYGLEFVDPAPEALDAASRFAQRYAVAPWYSLFERNRKGRTRIRPHLSDREVSREPFKLPVFLRLGEQEIQCTSRDLSIRATRCTLGVPLLEDQAYDVELISPLGSVFASAKVTDSREVTGPPHEVTEYVLSFEKFKGQSRSMLQSLIDLGGQEELRSELQVSHKRPPQPMIRPVLAGAFAAIVFSPVAVGVFKQMHNDDLLLAINDGAVAESVGHKNLDRIFLQTMSADDPDRMRLLLLKDALEQAERYDELVRVCRVLTARNPEEVDMGMALASALTYAGRYSESEDINHYWQERCANEKSQAGKYLTLQVLDARNMQAAGEPYKALDIFRRALASYPDDVTTRKEYAGLLLQLGLADEALSQYASLPQDRAVRLELVSIYSALEDFAAAERTVRELLREEPSSRELQLMLAEMLTWQKRYDESERIYYELLAQDPYDLEIRSSLAQTLTWSGRAEKALKAYGQMLDEGHDDELLLAGFLDAYLGAETRSENDTRRLSWLSKLYEREGARWSEEFPARLASALSEAGEYEKALKMLDSAVEAAPENRDLRIRYADALGEAGHHEEAQRHYRALLAEARNSKFGSK